MGKILIPFNGVDYEVDPQLIAPAKETMKEHLVTMAPEGNSGIEPITWDGVVGDRVTVNFGLFVFVKLTDTLLSPDELIGSVVTVSSGASYTLTSNYVTQLNGGVAGLEFAVTVVSDPVAFNESLVGVFGEAPGFTEVGTYFVYRSNTNVYTQSLTFSSTSGSNTPVVEPGATLTFKSEIKTEDIPADHMSPQGRYTVFGYSGRYDVDFRCFPCNDSYGFWIILCDNEIGEEKVFMDAVFTGYHGDGSTAPLEAGWYVQDDYSTKIAPPILHIPEDMNVEDFDGFFSHWMLFESPSTNSPVIHFDSTTYPVDADKLSAATDVFVAHVETLKGEGGTIDSITWDCVVGDRVTGFIPGEGGGMQLVKVSDIVPSVDDVASSTLAFVTPDGEYDEMTAASQGGAAADEYIIFSYMGLVVCVSKLQEDSETTSGMYLPETGTYFADLAALGMPMSSITLKFANSIAGGSSGGDIKITINGTEYPIDSSKLAEAIAAIEAVLSTLHDGSIELTILDEAILENTTLD